MSVDRNEGDSKLPQVVVDVPVPNSSTNRNLAYALALAAVWGLPLLKVWTDEAVLYPAVPTTLIQANLPAV